MKNLLYVSIVLSVFVILQELTYIGETNLAWVILLLAVAIGLQGVYLIKNKE